MKDINYEGPPLEENNETATPLRSKGSADAPTLRTLRTDVGDLIGSGKTTAVDVVIAEKKRREELGLPRIKEEEGRPHLGRIIFILTLILAFSIGVGAYALFGTKISLPFLSEKNSQATKQSETPNDTSLAIGHSSRAQILADIATVFTKTTLARGDMRTVIFTAGDAQIATTSALLSLLATKRLPQGLIHSLDETANYRIYSTGSLVGFLELYSRSYTETFAGMLKWEPEMGVDLISALNPSVTKGDINALHGRAFKDERILDVDARVLSDPDNVSSLAYAFIDQKTLIIAGGRETLTALIGKLRTKTN